MNKIFLTAGHHYSDPGASGNKFTENSLALEFVNLTSSFAREICPDIPIWNDNYLDPLSTVTQQVKSMGTKNDLWIEVHFNAYNGKATGYEALVSNNAGEFSKRVAHNLSFIPALMGIPNRGVKTEAQSKRGKLGMLNTIVPAVLLEMGFIDNESDMDKWKEKRVDVAKALAIYLVSLYKSKK